MTESAHHTERLELESPVDASYAQIVEHLRSEAIIRDEEDAVGRFAGVRTIIMQGRKGDRLVLLRGPWSELKKRVEEPMLTVSLEPSGAGCVATLKGEVPAEDSAGQKVVTAIVDMISVAVTIGALAYGVNRLRGLQVDWTNLGLLSVGGGIAYVLFGMFFGKETEDLAGAAWLRNEVKAALIGEDAGAQPAESDAATVDD